VSYGIHLRSAKFYTPDHEVIKFDDETGVGTVSITDYAQKSLGDVVFVELPEKGATVEKSGELSSFVCLKTSLPRPLRALTNAILYVQNLWVPLRALKPPLTSFVQHRTFPIALMFSHECHFSTLLFLGTLSASTKSWVANHLS
jgi:hypothetical protein